MVEYIYILAGAMAAVIVSNHVTFIKNLNNSDNISLEQISGIDLEALSICKTLGLM